jgi:N-acetylglucosaminyldiphosphoundecaprenol N-acetyl-beta-D-mannosaminyltransferase
VTSVLGSALAAERAERFTIVERPAPARPRPPVAVPPAAAAPARVEVFDIPIDLARPAELLERIVGWAAEDGPPRRVMYANAHVLNQSRAIPALGDALRGADVVYCDGHGVRLAARALDAEMPHRMTGADCMWAFARLCAQAGASVYLLGSEPGVAQEAAARLRARCPALDVAGCHHGYFEPGSPHDDRVIEDLRERRPDIVLVGMGSPKQELWVQRHAADLDCRVLWTVGALFDYLSGRVPRAPSWLADNGLEWIFRLAIEPQRMWRRYLLGNPVFVHRVLAQARGAHPGARA